MLTYKDQFALTDASTLLIHYLSNMIDVQNDDVVKMSQFLVEVLPQLIHMPSVPVNNQKGGFVVCSFAVLLCLTD